MQTAKQQSQLQAVICSLAQQLAKGGYQKGNSFSHLPHLCQSLGEAADSSVSYGQTSFHPRALFPLSPPFCLPMAKNLLVTGPELCLQDMKSSAAGVCNSTCQVPKEPSSKNFCLFVYLQCISFIFLLFQAFFSFFNCF